MEGLIARCELISKQWNIASTVRAYVSLDIVIMDYSSEKGSEKFGKPAVLCNY